MSDPMTRLNAALDGRYRIDRKVGAGGMATVYLAEEVRHRRPVALKVLHPELVSVLGVTRFEREIGIAASLRHPNILPLLDSGAADGFLFYAMPFIEEGSLREVLERRKQLPIGEAVSIAAEVASALSHSHERGVIHRDIKPSNIMMDHGRPAVSDYGIALVVQSVSTDRITASGFSPGSPEYMSPEQAAGEGKVDARSDIYSLGCVLYELLTGEPPFTARLPQAILAKKLLSHVPDPRVVRDSVPDHVADAVVTSLAKSPADRFQTADELRSALLESAARVAWSQPPGVEEHEPFAARRRGAPRLASLTRSPGMLAALVAGIVVALTAIGFFSTLAYDVTLAIPPEYTPSRIDFPIVGARALVQPLFWVFVLTTGYVVGRYALRATAFGMVRVPRVGPTLGSWGRRTAEAGRSIDRLGPSAIADLYFIGAVLLGLLALRLLWRLLAVFTAPYDTRVLAPEFAGLHHWYTLLLTALVLGLAVGWHRVFGVWLHGREGGARIALAKWGGLAWIAILVVVMTWPWRLLWDNNHPRALLGGEPAYILLENESEVVVYDPVSRATERHRKDAALDLERLGTIGYLFEGTRAFDEADSG